MATIGETTRPGFVYDSATDTWIPVGVGPHSHTPAAIGAISSSVVTTKGDLIVATGSGTVVRQGVGADGTVLMADSSQTDGVSWAGPSYVGAKNFIIGGAFDTWQRGTSFAQSSATYGYTADRWLGLTESGCSATYSQQTSSLPAGFRYSMRSQRNSGNTGTNALGISQALETSTSIPMQGQTIVLSYWAKAGANYSNSSNILNVRINSGTGVDQSAITQFGGWTGYAETAPNQAITTTWTRYQAIYNVPANATQLGLRFFMYGSGTAGANDWFEITGVQLEIGSVATPFARAGGTIAGELAACQRYYIRYNGGSTTGANYQVAGNAISSTTIDSYFQLPVTLRSTPSSIDFTNLGIYRVNNGTIYNSGGWYLETSSTGNTFSARYIHGSAVFTQGTDSTILVTGSNGASYIGFSAEL